MQEWRQHIKDTAAAICVRLVDVSETLAIHITTRSLLRSSSTHEPSDPPLRVVFDLHEFMLLHSHRK